MINVEITSAISCRLDTTKPDILYECSLFYDGEYQDPVPKVSNVTVKGEGYMVSYPEPGNESEIALDYRFFEPLDCKVSIDRLNRNIIECYPEV